MSDPSRAAVASRYPWSVDESELASVSDGALVIEEGGNATLLRCRHAGGDFLFKKFRREHLAEVSEDALAALIAWRCDLPSADRVALDRITAWPRARVIRDGRLRGVLIPVAPDAYIRAGLRHVRRPRSMYDLISLPSRPTVPIEVKLRALSATIAAIVWLHERGVIVNDVQPENLLCGHDGAGIYVVDCDSMAAPESWGLVAPPSAPDLVLAGLPEVAPVTVAMDFAKLALMTLRTLLDRPDLTGFGDEDLARVADLVSADTAAFLDRALHHPDEDAAGWNAIAAAWTERAGPARPVVTAPVRIPVPQAPPAIAPSGRSRRGWLPHDFDYVPAPAPFILPARRSFHLPRQRRRQGLVLAGLAACVVILLVVIVVTHPEMVWGR